MTAGTTMATQPLLVELFTEELPPKALQRLGQAFADAIAGGLQQRGLVDDAASARMYATPRRLAVLLPAVREQAADKPYAEKLMPVSVGLTPAGEATPALLKKLAAKGLEGVDPSTLVRESDGKNEQLIYRGVARGAQLADGLQEALNEALGKLPIPKTMSYQLADGQTTVRFVRPAHRLVALHGSTVVSISALGLQAGRETFGHRFQSAQTPIVLADAASYEATLAEAGRVTASFTARRDLIEQQLRDQARRLGASLGDEADVTPLLDEVTALVERPTVYVGEFEEEFLQVPQECLILTMRLNQKYFPLFEADGKRLTNRFLIVSNMALDDPSNIVQGNQRVVRPRLADARFFFETDRKATLASRVASLGNIVYHNKLGSQLQRTERVAKLAGWVADAIGGNAQAAQRAATLAKADLVTSMVGEFPELQGIMGAYYAANDQEPVDVVDAIRAQYRIRLDEPVAPATATTAALFIAERAETLVGIWAIGLAPTGDRDPFGLRRAALGLISAFEQLTAGGVLNVRDAAPAFTLDALLRQAIAGFGEAIIPASRADELSSELRNFIHERLRNQLSGAHDRSVIDAVLAVQPPLHQIPARVAAVAQFQSLPAAASLAAANKRIGNLLKKAEETGSEPNEALLQEPAEKALLQVIRELQPVADGQVAQGDFTASLTTLAGARDAVDAFFNDVMVMAEDLQVRANRLALLGRLHAMMNQVADLGRLA